MSVVWVGQWPTHFYKDWNGAHGQHVSRSRRPRPKCWLRCHVVGNLSWLAVDVQWTYLNQKLSRSSNRHCQMQHMYWKSGITFISFASVANDQIVSWNFPNVSIPLVYRCRCQHRSSTHRGRNMLFLFACSNSSYNWPVSPLLLALLFLTSFVTFCQRHRRHKGGRSRNCRLILALSDDINGSGHHWLYCRCY